MGICLGAVAAFATGGLLASVVFGVSPRDPLTFGATGVVMAVVTLVACVVPALNAARVEPMVALRAE